MDRGRLAALATSLARAQTLHDRFGEVLRVEETLAAETTEEKEWTAGETRALLEAVARAQFSGSLDERMAALRRACKEAGVERTEKELTAYLQLLEGCFGNASEGGLKFAGECFREGTERQTPQEGNRSAKEDVKTGLPARSDSEILLLIKVSSYPKCLLIANRAAALLSMILTSKIQHVVERLTVAYRRFRVRATVADLKSYGTFSGIYGIRNKEPLCITVSVSLSTVCIFCLISESFQQSISIMQSINLIGSCKQLNLEFSLRTVPEIMYPHKLTLECFETHNFYFAGRCPILASFQVQRNWPNASRQQDSRPGAGNPYPEPPIKAS